MNTSLEPILTVKNLRKSYNGEEVLKGVDFTVEKGKVKAILGKSGSGKSTMLRLMALLEEPDAGRVILGEEEMGVTPRGRRLPERKLVMQRREIGMVFQRFNLFPHLTAAENVGLALRRVARVSRADANEQSLEMLDRVGLGRHVHQYPNELSGGQQQRAAIARALVLHPAVLLFDEPTSALDPQLVNEVLGVMEQLANDGMTMVVVTHEMRFARRVADEVALFDEGVIVEQALSQQFFEAPQHAVTRAFLSHVH